MSKIFDNTLIKIVLFRLGTRKILTNLKIDQFALFNKPSKRQKMKKNEI